ncbi:TetR/AcrR family transcriptional regulator [Rhizorhabdus wittichii]
MRSRQTTRRLEPRDPRGGRPTSEIAARLGEHILDVALEHFVAHGVDGASMEAIASAASVSKRTLYSRFGSKMSLLMAAVDHGVARHIRPVRTGTSAMPVGQRLVHVGRQMLDIALSPEAAGLAALVYWIKGHGTTSEVAKSYLVARTAVAIFENILRDAPGANDVAPADLSFLASLIFDLVVTVPRQRILVRQDLENSSRAKAEYIERTIAMLCGGVPLLAATPEAGTRTPDINDLH